jgi:hypothetical protein
VARLFEEDDLSVSILLCIFHCGIAKRAAFPPPQGCSEFFVAAHRALAETRPLARLRLESRRGSSRLGVKAEPVETPRCDDRCKRECRDDIPSVHEFCLVFPSGAEVFRPMSIRQRSEGATSNKDSTHLYQ